VTYIKIERMSKDWKSPVYAFYEPVPEIEYVDSRRTHVFKCMAVRCKYRARRYLDTKDKSSTGNLIKHVKLCWGDEVWKAASECKNAGEARAAVVKPFAKSGNITASFERTGKGTVTYMHRQHTKTETKYVGSPIKMNRLTTIPGRKLFDGLQKVAVRLRLSKTEDF
jgi:hypothetical protein